MMVCGVWYSMFGNDARANDQQAGLANGSRSYPTPGSSGNTKQETPNLLLLVRLRLGLGLRAGLALLVPVLELLHAAGGVHQLHLAGEEGVAGARDVELDERV